MASTLTQLVHISGSTIIQFTETDPALLNVDAVVEEQDTNLILGKSPVILDTIESFPAMVKKMQQQTCEKVSNVLVKQSTPMRFIAIIYDIEHTPIGEKTWFKGDEVTITTKSYELHGGMFQDAVTGDGKTVTIKAREKAQPTDLAGPVDETAQALHDKNEDRKAKQRNAPDMSAGPGDLFSDAGKQMDIADIPADKKPTDSAPEVVAKPEEPSRQREEKEPWQMTQEEYVDGHIKSQGMHREGVRLALARGDAVPDEVLKDYPDLKPAAKPGFTPTHELPDGTLVKETEEDGVYIDRDGDEWEESNATPITKPQTGPEKLEASRKGKPLNKILMPPTKVTLDDGKVVEIQLTAQQAIDAADAKINGLESLRVCMNG